MEPTPRIRGRDSELDALGSFISAVRDGPAVVLLEGVAGIGKTTVWTAGVAMATAAGYCVLRSRPVPAEARLGFAGLGDLLATVDDAEIDRLPSALHNAIDAALLRSDRTTADPRAVAVAVAGLLSGMSADRPVVIAIDDVQWLDAATERVLRFVLRRLDGEHVGFLSARRREPNEHAAGPAAMARALKDVPYERIRIGPLAPENVIGLLRSELSIDLPKATLNQVVQTSGGNPLYALEVGRGLSSAPALAPGEPLPIPDNLRSVVRRRLQPLDAPTRRALLMLALLGRPRVEIVARALDRDGVSLDAAFDAGLVARDADDVRFTHPLLASAVVSDVKPEDRRAAHRRLADVVDDVEERARHLALGADGADERVAAELEAAATVARSRGAPEAAAEMLELAASLTPPSHVTERQRLTVAAAEDLFNGGDVRHARELLEGVIAVAEPGPRRAHALGLLASVRFTSDSASEALVLAEQALIEAEGDVGLSLSLEFTAALTLSVIGDYNRAKAHLARAAESAAQLGIKEAVDAARGFELMLDSPLAPDLDAWSGIEALPLPGGNDFIRANRLVWEGDLDEARPVLERMRTEVLAAGDDASLPVVLMMLMRVELYSGRVDRARMHGAEAFAITEATGRDAMHAVVLSILMHVYALQDSEDEVRAAVLAGIALAERTGALSAIPDMLWALGVLDLSTGDAQNAALRLAEGRERIVAMGVDHPAAVRFAVEEVDALVVCGRLDDAEARLELFPTTGVAGQVSWIRAAHARARGLVAASRGDPETALRELTTALELLAPTPMRLELALTLLSDGRVRRRSMQWGSARRSLSEALALFEEFGAQHWAAQARAELGRVGGRQPHGDELSATEQRVAALAANGRTNREVAAELFLSQKTVEWHLSRIYRKLGIRNRTELGTKVTRLNAVE